jgi:hypothetical protein
MCVTTPRVSKTGLTPASRLRATTSIRREEVKRV